MLHRFLSRAAVRCHASSSCSPAAGVTATPNPVQQVVKEPIPVGYTIRLDLVGKDASNKDSLGQKQIESNDLRFTFVE